MEVADETLLTRVVDRVLEEETESPVEVTDVTPLARVSERVLEEEEDEEDEVDVCAAGCEG